MQVKIEVDGEVVFDEDAQGIVYGVAPSDGKALVGTYGPHAQVTSFLIHLMQAYFFSTFGMEQTEEDG